MGYSRPGARRADTRIAYVYVEEAQRRTRPREPARRFRLANEKPGDEIQNRCDATADEGVGQLRHDVLDVVDPGGER